MIKSKVVLEIEKSDQLNHRLYQFMCLPESPLGEIYDVLNEMRSMIIQRIMDEQKSQKVDEPESPQSQE